ncbi:MAG: methylenetetrahydrofolate--tRNA-(uracil(54)-C(5))-methyltransferase (FADH(2)-oxidizing) TrmFO [Candidatus Gastranaerophilales bacterium]|nr:methylenetetrahydrofolate--tRNA-(uracil(54)-C(5))-methyltransferase (FADH(2)-oxidizing) TrmFO [Candidatus Gastranaerophilales bacterium]
MEEINIIGAGLAGSEAAIYLAKKGVKVNLYEMRPEKTTGAHRSGYCAEFVCSNSLGATALTSASGLLKEEIKILGSTLIEEAFNCRVPSGASLSIDRFGFSKKITDIVKNNQNINYVTKEITAIPNEGINIIATGPLTSMALCEDIIKKTGEENFKFFDAVAPIIKKESVDFKKAFFASRWDKGEADFINCPMTKEEYENFYRILTTAQTIELKNFEAKFFEGCMPVEVMAKRGKDTLRFGPLKPVGLFDKRIPSDYKKQQFYAVVQLRQDDKEGDLYNLVGFQTNLKWNEQKRLIHSIPSLENAEITRYGVMHANSFINSPKILNKTLNTKNNPDLFFAGQITGVEGYTESIATGLLAGINAYRHLTGKNLCELPPVTMLGALIDYITYPEHKNFQPINSNWGIVSKIEADKKIKKDKQLKNTLLANRSIECILKIKNKIESP